MLSEIIPTCRIVKPSRHPAKKGFKDAFLIAYKDGKRVPLNQLP